MCNGEGDNIWNGGEGNGTCSNKLVVRVLLHALLVPVGGEGR